MRETGFEPAQALSHWILSPTHLTTLALPHAFTKKSRQNTLNNYPIREIFLNMVLIFQL